MMKHLVFFLVCAVVFSCGNMAENNLDEIADDYCGCFSSQQKSLSKKTKRFIKIMAEGERDQEVLAKEREKLSEEEVADFTEFFAMLQKPNSKVGKCIAKVDKKVEKFRTKDKNKFIDKLVDEMESRSDCKVAAYVFIMGKDAMKGKKTLDESEEEE
jgi:hypothetical protein